MDKLELPAKKENISPAEMLADARRQAEAIEQEVQLMRAEAAHAYMVSTWE